MDKSSDGKKFFFNHGFFLIGKKFLKKSYEVEAKSSGLWGIKKTANRIFFQIFCLLKKPLMERFFIGFFKLKKNLEKKLKLKPKAPNFKELEKLQIEEIWKT